MANATGRQNGSLWLAAGYISLMTETPPTKPPPPLFQRLKLADRFRDVTAEHIGERLVITNYGSWDGSATAKWEKIVPKKKPDDELKGAEVAGDHLVDGQYQRRRE